MQFCLSCLLAMQAVLGVPIVLWLFFAKPVSLKTMRGTEESAVSSLAGLLPRRQLTCPAYVCMASLPLSHNWA